MAVLVTGGTGYIGSHTVVELLQNNEEVIVVDNFSNSSPIVVNRINMITNKQFKFYELDASKEDQLEKVFKENNIDSVIHFAAYKSVSESIENPLKYYTNNINSALTVLNLMKKYNVNKFIFSSSATVYGNTKSLPIKEHEELYSTNPYGRTKIMIEEVIKDISESDKSFKSIILRYFNPVGAHESGLIGEDPNGIPNNLMPYITQVAIGNLEKINVYGNNYNTHDGTGVRDYIHVVDLAKGHVKALEKLNNKSGVNIYNLGTGTGYSVLDVIKTFEDVNKLDLNYEIVKERPGDIAACFSDVIKANIELEWKAQYGLEDMCKDSWKWQAMNPFGYHHLL